MQHRSYPTQPETPAPPPFALHLVHGWWVASCPECGHELGRSRDQARAEQAGERCRCPICQPERPARRTFQLRPGQRIRFATVDGSTHTAWVVLDYFDVIVHVMRQDVRERYDLESLWGDAPRLRLRTPKEPSKR